MNLNPDLVGQPMQEQEQNRGLSAQYRKRRLWLIVIAHLLIVGTFFAASFIWGNFA
jgi:hypothetical protein